MTNPFLAKLAAAKLPATTPSPTTNAADADVILKPEVVEESTVADEPKALNPFLAKLAQIKATQQQAATATATASPPKAADDVKDRSGELVYYDPDGKIVFNTDDRLITLNDRQMEAVTMAGEGKSFVLTGAAGTGKTTAQAGVVWSLHEAGAFGLHDFKYIGNAPSIALVAFTKVAVRNMQKALRKNPLISQYEQHCMTIHSLLEYEPEDYTEYDLESGENVDKWGFRPQRHANNPLQLTHLIIEEASMVDLTLWQALFDALPAEVQIIFLGDINQLRPVFGDSILIYALDLLPVIELTEVYRQALESPIISNAHNILNGRSIASCGTGKFNVVEGKSNIKVGQEHMAMAMVANVKYLTEHGKFNPEEDMILCPWNKHAMGTSRINEEIATWLGIERRAEVIEVRAGRNRWWLATGDRVLVDKRLGTITEITTNGKYHGGTTRRGTYTRAGTPIIGGYQTDSSAANEVSEADLLAELDYSDFSLSEIEDDADENSRAASHLVTVVFSDDELATPHTLDTAGAFGADKFQFGYAITVHKAQGSEWDRVLLMLHWDHSTTLTREFLYTAVTRAAKEFTVFGKMHLIDQAIARASLKGQTLADKIAYFNAGLTKRDDIPLLLKVKSA